jgi:uncharacterized protein with HEPN domain
MNKNDLIRLHHMLDAAREAQAFIQDRTRDHREVDRILTLALVKSIEIIGEAAAKVTPQGRDQAPQIPWSIIVGMRNRLVHGYFEVDLDRVWATVTNDLPPLIAALEEVIAAAEA